MPELPEVETIRRQLEKEVGGFTIAEVKTNWPKAFQPSYEAVRKTIVGRRIAAVERQAKLLIFYLAEKDPSGSLRKPEGSEKIAAQTRRVKSEKVYLLFHLKLTGRLLVRPPGAPPDDFTRAVFTLKKPFPPTGGSTRRVKGTRRVRGAVEKELRFADARKFGFVRLLKDEMEMADLRWGYGPEPFKDLDLAKFREVLGSSARPVKIVLMDQTKIAGVGNIYANEALWLAKISPRLPSNKVSNDKVKDLYEAVLRVLTLGLKYGGASDNAYVQIHGEKGQYQEHFLVYGRQSQPCTRCQTKLLRLSLGGRGTFYCPHCQK